MKKSLAEELRSYANILTENNDHAYDTSIEGLTHIDDGDSTTYRFSENDTSVTFYGNKNSGEIRVKDSEGHVLDTFEYYVDSSNDVMVVVDRNKKSVAKFPRTDEQIDEFAAELLYKY